jgi:predicted alpha-1,2-mannosidase
MMTYPTMIFRAIFCGSLLSVMWLSAPSILLAQESPVDYVDPFIGTGGHGHTFPGATVPFGMVQLSPDTRLSGWDGCSGYHYSDSIVYGFSHTHLSGTGVSDYGDILLMPLTGLGYMNNGADGRSGYRSRFSKSSEVAEPGYYRVFLDDHKVDVELTATPRAGFHRYTFSPDGDPKVVLDLAHRDELLSTTFEQVSDTEWEGSRISKAWAEEQHVYFVIQFSRPAERWMAEYDGGSGIPEEENDEDLYPARAVFAFTPSAEPLLVKVGISAVDIEGARKNLEAELKDRDFDEVREAAREAWASELSKITVKGGTREQRTIFYTSLYHMMIAPNLFMDVDGRYRGTDLEIHTAEGFTNYTVFSLWDTYRTAHPLLTVIDSARTTDFVSTMLHQYKNGGRLPMWELSGNYTGCMIGYHAVPVIADAWLKGIRGYDQNLALEAMVHSAMQKRLGIDHYQTYGYVPADMESESVSKTLEYAYDDYCIARMAEEMGAAAQAREYYSRAKYYRNLFDPSTTFMRARSNNGWVGPFDPAEVNFHYTEANAWQYSFYVPQDIDHWISMLGGREALEQQLDELFTAASATSGRNQPDITGMIGQYAHGNEPSHHIAWLYNFAGAPHKTQRMVRRIMDSLYLATPDGLSGNEDCGQMSAWLVSSALGLYPVTPGSNTWIAGSPWFDKAIVKLENGNTFTITANNQSPDNIYVQSATLNGSPQRKSWLSHEDIMKGGEWVVELGPEPGTQFGVGEENIPSQALPGPEVVTVPALSTSTRTFRDSLVLELSTPEDGVTIKYAFKPDLSDARPYQGPIVITESAEFATWAETRGGDVSKVGRSSFLRIPGDRTVLVKHAWAPQYEGGGQDALIDGLKGGQDFRTGGWQGYQGVDLDAVVTFDAPQTFSTISAGFLQDQKSWIFMPREVEFFVKEENGTFRSLGTAESGVSPEEDGSIVRDIRLVLDTPVTGTAVRVVARTIGRCPEWHLGAGGKAWIFADEITTE